MTYEIFMILMHEYFVNIGMRNRKFIIAGLKVERSMNDSIGFHYNIAKVQLRVN